MDKYFVDSSFWKALIDSNDSFYENAWKIRTEIGIKDLKLYTTNYVIDETYTLVRSKCGLEKCRILTDFIVSLDELLVIERVKIEDEEKSWKWFWNNWSKLSFTDCTSFAVMERLSIEKALTFDEHFSKAGFKIWQY